MDLLVVERGHILQALKKPQVEEWENLVKFPSPSLRPTMVVESWNPEAPTWSHGPVSKGTITRWKELGYETRCRRIGATQVGGAISQTKLLVLQLGPSVEKRWEWPDLEGDPSTIRPMSNLLTPPGLVPRHRWVSHPEASKKALDSQTQPMPPRIGTFVQSAGRVCRLFPEEVTYGLVVAQTLSVPSP